MSEVSRDLGAAASNAILDARGRVDHTVEDDGKLPAHVLAGDALEDPRPVAVEGDADGRFPILIDADLGLLQPVAGQERLLVQEVGLARYLARPVDAFLVEDLPSVRHVARQ